MHNMQITPGKLKDSREKVKEAMACLIRFRWVGRLAFGLYLGLIASLAFSYLAEPSMGKSLFILLSFIGFLGLLWFTSFFYNTFFSIMGGNSEEEHPLMLLFMGMPLYLFIYMRQEKRMKDALKQRLKENELPAVRPLHPGQA